MTPWHRTETAASAHADLLAEVLGLDMTATW
jgi:hypothetical protein